VHGTRTYRCVKRAADVLVAGILLLALSWLLAIIAVGVWISMGRPVLFRHVRAGKGGRPFILLKFRTMRQASDERGRPLQDGQRLTRFGNLLRRTSLDELPSLWNVLVGDMSLVGPRPLLMEYLPRYSPTQSRRHEVSPGVTGWAQVNGRNAITWQQKFAHDVWYVDHCSLGLDARILLLTVWKVLKGEGISAPDHATMEEFKGNGR